MRAPTTRGPFSLLHLAPVLIGLSAGWQWCGLRRLLAAVIDPSQATVTMLTTVAVMGVAFGLQMPSQLAAILLRLVAWRRARKADTKAEQPAHPAPSDRVVFQLSLASTTVVVGLGCLLALVLMSLFARMHAALTGHFFWTPLTVTAMEWATFALFVGWLWVLDGLAVSVWAVAGDAHAADGRSEPVVAKLCLGFALAWTLHEMWLVHVLSGTEQLMLAAVPMLAVAVFTSLLPSETTRHLPPRVTGPPHVPELSTDTGQWIWAGLFTWAIGLAFTLYGWLACQTVASEAGIRPPLDASLVIVLVGLVALAASYAHGSNDRPSISGYAFSLWLAGLAAGAVVVTLAGSPPESTSAAWAQAILLAAGFGYALARLEAVWLACASSSAAAVAQIGSALFTGLAVGLIAAGDWVLPMIGPIGLIVTGALALISLGGFVQIHAHGPQLYRRRQQLAFTFGTLAIAILIFPPSTRTWSAWASAQQYGRSPAVISLEKLVARRWPRVCLINVPYSTHVKGATDSRRPSDRNANADSSDVPLAGTIESFADMTDAYRWIRLERRTYELIYQHDPVIFSTDRFAHYAQEWLDRLADHLAPGGRLVVDVPLAGKSVRTARVIGATFERAVGGHCCWTVATLGDRPVLRLVGGPLPFVKPDSCRPLNLLVDGSGGSDLIHSLQRDRITSTLAPDRQGTELLRWLTNANQAAVLKN